MKIIVNYEFKNKLLSQNMSGMSTENLCTPQYCLPFVMESNPWLPEYEALIPNVPYVWEDAATEPCAVFMNCYLRVTAEYVNSRATKAYGTA
jgi:hypothetical protein